MRLLGGPALVGATDRNSVCVIAPRTHWLPIIRDEFEAEGLKTALQLRRNRNGDHPVYAWICGLLAVACDPENTYEWIGVLREVFAVSDEMIAEAVAGGRLIRWDEPESYPEPVGRALAILMPFISRVNDEETRWAVSCTSLPRPAAFARWRAWSIPREASRTNWRGSLPTPTNGDRRAPDPANGCATCSRRSTAFGRRAAPSPTP